MTQEIREKKKIFVFPHDRRQEVLCRLLERDGYSVSTPGEDPLFGAAGQYSAFVLPIPASGAGNLINCPGCGVGLEELMRAVSPDALLIGGMFSPSEKKLAEDIGIQLFDYSDSEVFSVKNAALTAEAALGLIIQSLPLSLPDSRIAVAGYGRVGRILADDLHLLGANVTAAARKNSDVAWMQNAGLLPLKITVENGEQSLYSLASGYDMIVNTVPHWIFDAGFLEKLDKNTLMLELASSPGGFDRREAERLGINVIAAPGLPGKCSPVSAGRVLYEVTRSIIEERLLP